MKHELGDESQLTTHKSLGVANYEYKSERIERGYLHRESEIGELSFVKVVDRNTIMMEYVIKRDNFDGVGLVGLTFVRGRDGWKLTQLQYDI